MIPDIRVSAPCPWHLLNHPAASFGWRDESEQKAWFAVGTAKEFSTLEACRQYLADIAGRDDGIPPRAFMYMAFDSQMTASSSAPDFPTRRIVLPEVLFRWDAGSIDAWILGKTSRREVGSVLGSVDVTDRPFLVNIGEHSHFSRSEWDKAVRAIQIEIKRGTLRKAVLSRQISLIADRSLDAATVIEHLAEQSGDCISFAYHHPGHGVFLGATPERLFRLNSGQVTVDSLAGSRPRGRSDKEDQQFTNELSASVKDQHEQDLVTSYIREQLQHVADGVETQTTQRVRKLPTVQHLHTTITAKLRRETTLDDLVEALHPTPATCGLPVAEARNLIARLEPLPRGMYAGILGWISPTKADIAVMIRSGYVQDNTARLFAGAGIVEESDPDAEYDECEWKLQPLRKAVSRSLS